MLIYTDCVALQKKRGKAVGITEREHHEISHKSTEHDYAFQQEVDS